MQRNMLSLSKFASQLLIKMSYEDGWVGSNRASAHFLSRLVVDCLLAFCLYLYSKVEHKFILYVANHNIMYLVDI